MVWLNSINIRFNTSNPLIFFISRIQSFYSIDPNENEYIPIPIQNRHAEFDFHDEKLKRRNEEISKRGKLSITNEERNIWLTKLRIQTRDCVNTTSIGMFSSHF